MDLAAPTADWLAYLAAAEKVQPIDPVVGEPKKLTGYRFDINGPRFAEYVRQQMGANLRQSFRPMLFMRLQTVQLGLRFGTQLGDPQYESDAEVRKSKEKDKSIASAQYLFSITSRASLT